MKKLLLSCLILGSSSVYAAGNTYVDGNIGVNTSWSTLALNADVGYMFNKYVGLEGGFTYSPGYSQSWYNASYSSDYWMFDGAVKGVLPLSNIVSLYGKLGIAFNNYTSSWSGNCPGCNASYTGSDVGLLVGGGAQFNLSRDWSLHLEDYTSTGGNPNMFVFGAQYNF